TSKSAASTRRVASSSVAACDTACPADSSTRRSPFSPASSPPARSTRAIVIIQAIGRFGLEYRPVLIAAEVRFGRARSWQRVARRGRGEATCHHEQAQQVEGPALSHRSTTAFTRRRGAGGGAEKG